MKNEIDSNLLLQYWKEKEHSSALNGDDLKLTDVIENFWQSYYGENCPYQEKSLSQNNKINSAPKDRNRDHPTENMRNGINGTAKKTLLLDMKNSKKNKFSDQNNERGKTMPDNTVRTDLPPFDFTFEKEKGQRPHLLIVKNVVKSEKTNYAVTAVAAAVAAAPTSTSRSKLVNMSTGSIAKQNNIDRMKKSRDTINSVLWPDIRTPEIYGARVLGPKNGSTNVPKQTK